VADDDIALGPDGRFAHTFESAGAYYLEVRDVRYRGGANFRYRLRVSSRQEGFSSLNETVHLLHPAVSELNFIDAKFPKPYPATLPGTIEGSFDEAKERDEYALTAKTGTYTFRPITRSAGSAAYLMLKVFKPDGGLLAESPVTESDEQPLTATFPAEGRYRLQVEDLLGRGGPEFNYFIESALHPGFSLSLKPDKNVPQKYRLPQGGAVAIEVQAAHSGYAGPITLAVEPADLGLTLLNNVIPANQAATKIVLIAPASLNIGDLLPLRIVGTAEHQGQQHTVPVSTAGMVRAKWPQIAYPPAWLDGLIPVGVVAEGTPFYAVTSSAPSLVYPRSAAQIGFTLNLERKNGEFKEPLLVSVENLPIGMSYEVKREGNGPQEKYQIALKAPATIGEIKQEIRVISYGDLKGQGQVATTTLPLEIIAPLAVTLAPNGPIEKGQKQTIKVAISRYNAGEDKQPITVKWKKLPAGVSAPDTTIAPDQVEAAVELTAAADAAPGVFDGVVAEALTKFRGVDVAVESPPVKWEVK
jgi:hypothetical protein